MGVCVCAHVMSMIIVVWRILSKPRVLLHFCSTYIITYGNIKWGIVLAIIVSFWSLIIDAFSVANIIMASCCPCGSACWDDDAFPECVCVYQWFSLYLSVILPVLLLCLQGVRLTWWSHTVGDAVLRQVSHQTMPWASYGNRDMLRSSPLPYCLIIIHSSLHLPHAHRKAPSRFPPSHCTLTVSSQCCPLLYSHLSSVSFLQKLLLRALIIRRVWKSWF